MSLSEEALFVFEAKDSNVEWYMKVTAAIQNAVWCYHVIYDKRKRATTQTLGFPGGTVGKEPACQCSRHKRHGFHPWVRKISWSRKWQPTPVFLPGKLHGQRSLAGCTVHEVAKN